MKVCGWFFLALYVMEIAGRLWWEDSMVRPSKFLVIITEASMNAWHAVGELISGIFDIFNWIDRILNFVKKLRRIFRSVIDAIMPWLVVFYEPFWDLGEGVISLATSPLRMLTGFHDGMVDIAKISLVRLWFVVVLATAMIFSVFYILLSSKG